jgi:hypothetical protein
MKYTEQHPKIKAAARNLAQYGIVAFYGGRKGHGFWLYQSTVEDAMAQCERFDVTKDYAGKVIKNDGMRSGNDCFWLFADAMQLCYWMNQDAQVESNRAIVRQLWNELNRKPTLQEMEQALL